jgi:hypothetical protein
MRQPKPTTRRYHLEGGLNLHSGKPFVITPRELTKFDKKTEVSLSRLGYNIYIVATRTRIKVHPTPRIWGRHLLGYLSGGREEGAWFVPFEYPLPGHFADWLLPTTRAVHVVVGAGGGHVELHQDGGGDPLEIASWALVAAAPLEEVDKDLRVLYVGQAQGKKYEGRVVRRISCHKAVQRILMEMHEIDCDSELLFLIYQFNDAHKLLCTGGDLSLEPTASDEEEFQHHKRMAAATFTRKQLIDIAEAAMINHFKPRYNNVFTDSDFQNSKYTKILKVALDADLTSLAVAVDSTVINARLGSERAPHDTDRYRMALKILEFARTIEDDSEMQRSRAVCEAYRMMRTTIGTFALTRMHERETYMHGMKWLNADERVPFM